MQYKTLDDKLKEYLELLGSIKKYTADERAALVLLQELSKDVRMDRIRDEREQEITLATRRQKRFPEKLGVDIDRDLTHLPQQLA